MVTLYITSKEAGAGRTTVGAGIGKYLKDDGKKIGFLKPVVQGTENVPGKISDKDSIFMKSLFALDESLDRIRPVFNSRDNLLNRIKRVRDEAGSGKDVVIVEGDYEQDIVKALDARVIIIDNYPFQLLDAELISTGKKYGKNLLGLVLNRVPSNQLEHVRNKVSAQLAKTGISVLGMLPGDRVLSTLSIAELAESLHGEVLNSADKSSELLESIMLGAMTVDSGLEYFGRKINKAVITRSERPDMQLAALETSTRCLVLSGHAAPNRTVSYVAEGKGIPIILVEDNIATIATGIENALNETRFNQEKKLPRLVELIRQYFNRDILYKGVGLGS